MLPGTWLVFRIFPIRVANGSDGTAIELAIDLKGLEHAGRHELVEWFARVVVYFGSSYPVAFKKYGSVTCVLDCDSAGVASLERGTLHAQESRAGSSIQRGCALHRLPTRTNVFLTI